MRLYIYIYIYTDSSIEIKKEKNKINSKINNKSYASDKSKIAGITLIALVITIIVLIILAGITIISINGNNGILGKTKIAKGKYQNSTNEENKKISNYENEIDKHVSSSSRFSVETIDLWSGNAATGNYITLSESYQNFKALIIYFGNPKDNAISAQKVELSTLNWIKANNRFFRLLWYYNEYVQFSITDDTTLLVNNNYIATIAKITGIKYE